MSLSDRDWTQFQIDAEVESFGVARLVAEYNRLRAELELVRQQRDVAIEHIAAWCVAIDVNGGSWDEWDDYYKDALHRKTELPEIRELLEAAVAKEREHRKNW